MPLGIPYTTFLEDWDDHSREAAIEFLRYKKESCSNCGTVSNDWLDAEGQLREQPPAHVVSTRCVGCEVLAHENEQANENRSSRRFNFSWMRNPLWTKQSKSA